MDNTQDYAATTEELTKRYGSSIVAVDHLTLGIRRGEVYGFIGPNGAGKTTTLRMLLGLIRPTSGRALVLGKPPGDPEALARLGSLIEWPTFYPYLSGRDNLRVIARYVGVAARRIEDALERVDLTARADSSFQTYSLGMKQRLGVAAALLKDPDLLILDEPTNGLDPPGMAEMRTLIRELQGEGRTVLLSSHQLGDVQQLCNQVGVISGGRLVAEGTIPELCSTDALLVRAHPLEGARNVAERVLGRGAVRALDGALRVRADSSQASLLNRKLASAGVEVLELRPVERSLEEVFFELTSGETAGAGSLRQKSKR